MIVHYKRNKHTACFYTNNTADRVRPQPIERPHGPFASCEDCPYASHGFMCYGKEGDCLRTDMEKIHERGRKKKQCVQ